MVSTFYTEAISWLIPHVPLIFFRLARIFLTFQVLHRVMAQVHRPLRIRHGEFTMEMRDSTWSDHGKPLENGGLMGLNGILMGFDGIYPLVLKHSYWKWPLIVDVHIKKIVIFHSYAAMILNYQRVTMNIEWTRAIETWTHSIDWFKGKITGNSHISW